MASEIRVNKINSQTGVGTITLSPTGVDISGITTAATLKVGTGVTVSSDGDIFFTGIATATTFVGNLTGDPTGSGANLTALPAGQLTGTVADARISTLTASKLSGALPAISALNLTNVPAANVVGVHTSLNITGATVVGSAVTISESGIEASGIGITCANINGTQIGGRRNLVINGAMRVAQRGTSSTSNGYYTVDRMRNAEGGTDENPTQEQGSVASGTTPYTLGFRKTYKHTNGNQTGGVGATDYYGVLEHSVEAHDIQHSGWNFLSPSSFITLSFWIKSSVAQAFSGSIELPDSSSIKFFKYDTPSLSADTWTKVTKTIPGNSNLAVDDNTSAGLIIRLYGYIGTTYTTSNSDTETWVSGSNRYANTMTTTWYTTNDATLEITGLQLEVGSQATAFEHRSFAEELTLCQRYFQVLGGSNGTYDSMATGSCASSTVAYVPHRLVATMRSTPSFTLVGSASDFRYTKGGDQTPSGLTLDQAGANMVAVRVSAASDHLGTDDAIRLFNVNTTGAFQFDAEI